MKKAVEVARTIKAAPAEVWKIMVLQSCLQALRSRPTGWRVEREALSGSRQDRSPRTARKLVFTHWSEFSGKKDPPENSHAVPYTLEGDDRSTPVTVTQFNHDGEISTKRLRRT
ncbi:hypothetical protein FHS20_003614 [Phyllobacterium endophyticum]|uniref:Uncharacterized protein n=1 Tax=Phyllobacterium endophyticum TaxID=1149773 RepID=A0A2P7ARZ8_9HYPH|nr:hypothetical protein [Phyllobacterium endophyticum]PSH57004.1 hypothetical protein CU100_17115 [Phyllobacterium endophyticum]